jgi:lipopolysaccharide biosynthesis protein
VSNQRKKTHRKYLELVDNRHKLRANIRDLIVRLITRSSILKLHDVKPRAQLVQHESVCVTSELKVFHDMVVMAHYDPKGKFSDADRFLLRKFKEIGFEIVLVSTAVNGQAKHDQLWKDIQNDVDCLITRLNIGFDFGSWACALSELGIVPKIKGNLILVNNSVFGPFYPLGDLIQSWPEECEILGVTTSQEFVPHVQSYFLAFRNSLVQDEAFKFFWSTDFLQENKRLTILSNEMRWARYFKRKGFQVFVKHEAPEGYFRNPLTFFWKELLIDGMPFLKKSLFVQNYDNLDLTHWKSDLSECETDFPIKYIEQHINESDRG